MSGEHEVSVLPVDDEPSDAEDPGVVSADVAFGDVADFNFIFDVTDIFSI